MELVKDLAHDGIIFYWINQSGEKVSPYLRSLTLAKEWRIKFLFSAYEGKERRESIIDRRWDLEKRKGMERNHQFSRENPYGRRITDTLIKVDIDLVEEKIKEFY